MPAATRSLICHVNATLADIIYREASYAYQNLQLRVSVVEISGYVARCTLSMMDARACGRLCVRVAVGVTRNWVRARLSRCECQVLS